MYLTDVHDHIVHLRIREIYYPLPLILRFSRIFHIRRASPISGERIVAPIVLAQHKRNERIGKAQTPVCGASPIVIELAY
jgi:hypothetical protein